MDFTELKIGFAICGSFCTFKKTLPAMEKLKCAGAEIIPIMSDTAYYTDTRFGSAEEFRNKITSIVSADIIHTIHDAEPIGPKLCLDALVIMPCTGNTLGKLACGIADTSVTLAAKAHLRNNRPIIIGISTNDGLGIAAQNIGKLLTRKHIYFVPFRQDDAREMKIQLYFLSALVHFWCSSFIFGAVTAAWILCIQWEGRGFLRCSHYYLRKEIYTRNAASHIKKLQ